MNSQIGSKTVDFLPRYKMNITIFLAIQKLWYVGDVRNRFAVALPQFFPHLWGLRYIFFIVIFFLIFFAGNWNFGFFFFWEYAMLSIVIIMKKRGWILYPYSIFHAKITCGFVHHVLSIIPGTEISLSDLLIRPKLNFRSFGLFFDGTMDKTLIRYLNPVNAIFITTL